MVSGYDIKCLFNIFIYIILVTHNIKEPVNRQTKKIFHGRGDELFAYIFDLESSSDYITCFAVSANFMNTFGVSDSLL